MSWDEVPSRLRVKLRAAVAETLPAPCIRCSRLVLPSEPWDLDHRRSVRDYPELILDPSNHGPAHCSCNRSAGARMLRVQTWRAAL